MFSLCIAVFLQVGHTSSACEMLGKRRQVSKNYQETVTCKLVKMRLSVSALVETHKSQTLHSQGSSHQWHCHTDQIDQWNTNIVQSHLSECKGGMGKKLTKGSFDSKHT